jgi:hypothetical protein
MLISVALFNIMIHASEETPAKEEVAKLYVATFNRAPDQAGLNYRVSDL